MMTVVVHGPRACGKTRNAQAIAAHFRCRAIVDDFDRSIHHLTPGALHLTSEPLDGKSCSDAKIVKFASLPKALKAPLREIPNRGPKIKDLRGRP